MHDQGAKTAETCFIRSGMDDFWGKIAAHCCAFFLFPDDPAGPDAVIAEAVDGVGVDLFAADQNRHRRGAADRGDRQDAADAPVNGQIF